MENKRLRSYNFKCPCCEQFHKREFEYIAKYHGFISEKENLSDFDDPSMIEWVSMDDGTYEGRSVRSGEESVFRCGNCYEFFKFDDYEAEPRKLTENEERLAKYQFKPITIIKNNAVMNSVASFVTLVNKYGCSYDQETGDIIVKNEDGKEFKFNIAEQLFETLYAKNPMFDVKKSALWAYEKGE